MTGDGQTIALVGGGRWGRVHASNLALLLTSRDRVLWVTQHDQEAVRKAIAQLSEAGPEFELLTHHDEVLALRPRAALIVTAPANHVAMAARYLRQGIHTFVEKPLAFTAGDAQSLIDAATRADVVLAVGLHLLSASYLHHWKMQLAARGIARLSIRWFDPVHEVRYGEIKRADDTVPLAHDIYPHLWSIARTLTGSASRIIAEASKLADGSIMFESWAGSVKIDARCGRNAGARERKINLAFQDGKSGRPRFHAGARRGMARRRGAAAGSAMGKDAAARHGRGAGIPDSGFVPDGRSEVAAFGCELLRQHGRRGSPG
jgi:predicted dehydrogenase